MRSKIVLSLCVVSVFAMSCATSSQTGQTATNSFSEAVSQLPQASTLSQKYFAEYALGISNDDFNKRWQNSLESPLVFFRSHVRAYYDITKNLVLPIRATGVCFGDAHVENFGFVEASNRKARFLYNDLDDSGICPVLLDALRYFTSMRFLDDDDLVRKKIAFYLAILTGRESPVGLASSFKPKLKKVRKKLHRKMTINGRLVREPGVFEDVSPQIASDVSVFVKSVFGEDGLNYKVLDVVQATGFGGGSFGLTRYWVLLNSLEKDNEDSADAEQIVEIKEVVEPATSLGKWGQIQGDRLETLKSVFWGGASAARIYRQGNLHQKSFIVRNRVKASLSPEMESADDREAIYDAQISILAEVHKKSLVSLSNPEAEGIQHWLATTSSDLMRLYETAFEAAQR